MKTVNISLTEQQTKDVDNIVNQLGFANRSEFFRTLIRIFLKKPAVITEEDYLMQSPDTRSAKKVLNSFKKTGKYSKDFLTDLADGLVDSDYFTDDLPPR